MAIPPPKIERYSCTVFTTIVEMHQWFIHKSVPPTAGGYADQNPLLLEAFRVLGAADRREDEYKERKKKSKKPFNPNTIAGAEKMPLL